MLRPKERAESLHREWNYTGRKNSKYKGTKYKALSCMVLTVCKLQQATLAIDKWFRGKAAD